MNWPSPFWCWAVPGALVIGVPPVSHVAGIGNGARNGVLLKGSETISDFSRLDTIIFDKTGTLTVGNPSVAEQEYYGGEQIEEALSYLASVERESDHPLAKAVLAEIGETTFWPVQNTEVVKGEGITATINGQEVAVGNEALMNRVGARLSQQALQDAARLAKKREFAGVGRGQSRIENNDGHPRPNPPGRKKKIWPN